MRQRRPAVSVWRTTLGMALVLGAWASSGSVAAQDGEDLTIALNERENSGVSGTATLAADGENTRVSMELSGDPVTGDHPTHIHTGTCRDFDPDPLYPLTTVVLDEVSDDGESDTTVEDVALDDLLDDDYVILVHESAEELYPEWVCGDIKRVDQNEASAEDDQASAGNEEGGASAGGDDADGTSAGGTHAGGTHAGANEGPKPITRMPASGIGTTAGDVASSIAAFAVALAALAAVLVAGWLRFRRPSPR